MPLSLCRAGDRHSLFLQLQLLCSRPPPHILLALALRNFNSGAKRRLVSASSFEGGAFGERDFWRKALFMILELRRKGVYKIWKQMKQFLLLSAFCTGRKAKRGWEVGNNHKCRALLLLSLPFSCLRKLWWGIALFHLCKFSTFGLSGSENVFGDHYKVWAHEFFAYYSCFLVN
jgi:hypothetical protein